MASRVYKNARYYEIAFSFVRPKRQVNLFRRFINKYSRVKVRNVLDIACGTGLQLREFARRNYHVFGLDSSPEMLTYLKKESQGEGLAVKTVRADMIDFDLEQKIDFAYIMMGSIMYASRSNETFLSHLHSVARVLRPGGLYVLENFPLEWAHPAFWKPQSWRMKRHEVKVKATYHIVIKDALLQLITQILSLEVRDGRLRKNIVDKNIMKLIFPEELRVLVKLNRQFEFLGFFERDSARKLRYANNNNLVVLRRK